MKSKSKKTPQEKFQRAVDSLSTGMEALLGDPLPTFVIPLVTRFIRVFCPEMAFAKFMDNPEGFHGIGLAVMLELYKTAEAIELTAFPPHPFLDALKEGLRSLRISELPKIKRAISAAHDLPPVESRRFLAGLSIGLGNSTGGTLTETVRERIVGGNSCQICVFLLANCRVIALREVKSITELWKRFILVKRLFNPKWGMEEIAVRTRPSKTLKDAGNSGRILKSWEHQFRKICSEDGIKLAAKGRPRKNTPDKGGKKGK